MPKSRNSKDKSKTSNGADPITRDDGRILFPLVIPAGGYLVQPLSPEALAQRLGFLMDVYLLYRFVRLKIKVFPPGESASVPHALGLVIGPSDQTSASVTAVSQVIQCPFSVYVPPTVTVPETLVAPKAALMRGVNKWYLTETNAATVTSDEYQAFIFAAGIPNTTMQVLIDYTIEFTSPVGSVQAPRPITTTLNERLSSLEKKMNTGPLSLLSQGIP